MAYQLLSSFPALEWEMKKKVLREDYGDVSHGTLGLGGTLRVMRFSLPFGPASGLGGGGSLVE